MKILGLDIGTTGAIALYEPQKSAESGLRWFVQDLPDTKTLRTWLRRVEPTVCYLERTFHVGASFASYRLGLASGWAHAVLDCCDVPIVTIEARSWQSHFGLPTKRSVGTSKHTRAILNAAQLQLEGTPLVEMVKTLKQEHRAEAVMIAAYGAHHHGELL